MTSQEGCNVPLATEVWWLDGGSQFILAVSEFQNQVDHCCSTGTLPLQTTLSVISVSAKV